ncbi:hypothetical protein APHAL10511_005764 [Amanita phalloides]|nr:hypothetical protein APHAL10511_005764 [Amanita phalloides]
MVNIEGSNIPFSINSMITLENLQTLIAKKLDQSEDTQAIHLQYRLDSNKAKTAPTSIQSQEELEIFMLKMCHLIVPPLLSSGKISMCKLKPVTICFKNAAESAKEVTDLSKGMGKKPYSAVTNKEGKEAHCYKAPGTTLCYELSIYNLQYWASEMIKK